MSSVRMTIRVPSDFKRRIERMSGPGSVFTSNSSAVVALASAAEQLLRKKDPDIMAELLGVD